MKTPFNPRDFLITLPRRVKDPQTGQWSVRQDDYLEVKWRLVWFREQFPHGSIMTETILLDWDKGVCIHRAHVGDGEGGMATGTGTETRKSFEDFVEKSETRAIGRALAALGIGTQFVGEELSEGEHVADAPVTSLPPIPPTNGHKPEPKPKAEPARMTEEAIEALVHLAVEQCQEEREAFATRCRRAMKLKADVPITKRVLCESMTPEAYKVVFDWYTTLYAQLQRKTEVPDGSATTPKTPPEPTAETPEPAVEGPKVPFEGGSSSAPENGPDDAVERDRARLRQEIVSWDLRVKPEEIEHVIQHHPYSKARQLLWAARHQPEPALAS
jgi:hypothetical protein